LQRLPGSGCFRDGILRGKIDKLIECLGTSTWLTWTPYFLELCFCICSFLYFLYFFVVGCLGHDFLDGLRPPCTLGRHSLDVLFR
jgi:hypothetical protein